VVEPSIVVDAKFEPEVGEDAKLAEEFEELGQGFEESVEDFEEGLGELLSLGGVLPAFELSWG
jgi:hypothetical protein